MVGVRVNVVNVSRAGPGPMVGPLLFRFTVGEQLSYVTEYHLLVKNVGGMAHIQGVEGLLHITRFTVGRCASCAHSPHYAPTWLIYRG